MRISTQQKGFGALGVLLVIVIVAIIGFVGYRVASVQKSVSTDSIGSGVVPTSTIPTITKKADLDKATNTVNQAQLDKDLDSSKLDQDLNSLL
jgi:hypothetical protein